MEGYSLERYNSAPETLLTPEEQAFVDTYKARLESVIEKATKNPNLWAQIVAMAVNPDIYAALHDMKAAEALLEKEKGNKAGVLAMGREEAEDWNREYDRKVTAVEKATKELENFLRLVNDEDNTSYTSSSE